MLNLSKTQLTTFLFVPMSQYFNKVDINKFNSMLIDLPFEFTGGGWRTTMNALQLGYICYVLISRLLILDC